MTLYLDHTFVPAKDHRKAAKFIARILDVPYAGVWAGFAVVERLKKEGRPFGSGDGKDGMKDGKINHLHDGRGVYFECDDGHIWEVLTHTYVLSSFKKGPQD